MPNGGHPGNMVIIPNDDSPYVLFVGFKKILIYSKEDWKTVSKDIYKYALKEEGPKPIISMNESETGAILGHLDYWFGEAPFIDEFNMPKDLHVQYIY